MLQILISENMQTHDMLFDHDQDFKMKVVINL